MPIRNVDYSSMPLSAIFPISRNSALIARSRWSCLSGDCSSNGEGVATNAAEMRARLSKGLQVEIWNSAGDSKIVTAANAADLEGDTLKNFLHPPAKK